MSTLMPDAQWAQIVSLLVTYHLYLAWTVLSTGERSLANSVPIAVVTHVACVSLVVAGSLLRIPRGLLSLIAMVFPVVGMLKFGLVSIVLFERVWLFSGGKQKADAPAKRPKRKHADEDIAPLEATTELYQEWLAIRAQKKAHEYRPGETMMGEYENWRKTEAIRRHHAAELRDRLMREVAEQQRESGELAK